MMTTSKMVLGNNTYLVQQNDDGSRVELKVDPILIYAKLPEVVPLGTVQVIPMHVEDFDGAQRTDINQTATFYVSDTPIDANIINGAVTLSIEFSARGKHVIRVVPSGINMQPFTVEVV